MISEVDWFQSLALHCLAYIFKESKKHIFLFTWLYDLHNVTIFRSYMYMYSASWLLKSWFKISKFHFLVSIQLLCDLKNHADLGGCHFLWNEWVYNLLVCKAGEYRVGRTWSCKLWNGLQTLLGHQCIYICLFKYTIIVLVISSWYLHPVWCHAVQL